MPVDNDTDSGTQYTLGRPRPNAPTPGEIAAAAATAIAAVIQVVLFSSENPLAVAALVSTLVALGILVVTIVQNGVSQDVYYDIPSDPSAWTTLEKGQKGGPLPKNIAAADVILFRDPQTQEPQAVGGGVSTSDTTVHLVKPDQRGNQVVVDPAYTCTYS